MSHAGSTFRGQAVPDERKTNTVIAIEPAPPGTRSRRAANISIDRTAAAPAQSRRRWQVASAPATTRIWVLHTSTKRINSDDGMPICLQVGPREQISAKFY